MLPLIDIIFFLTNYLLHKNENNKAKELVNLKKNAENSNLLIKQTRNFILDGKNKKIKKFFNCKNPKDIIAENLYVIANLYSSENNYKLSNFYLKLSLFLNDKFTPYKTLLAENFLNQKKYKLSKITYNSLKSIGEVYSWYAAVNVAIILSEISTLEKSISSIEKDFNSISAPDFQHYYEVANFFKENEYHKKSIKYTNSLGDNESIATSLRSIAEIYQIKNHHTESLDFGQRSYLISKKIGHVKELRNISFLLYTSYKSTGNELKALEMYELYIQMRDSIKNEETEKKQWKFDFEKKMVEKDKVLLIKQIDSYND